MAAAATAAGVGEADGSNTNNSTSTSTSSRDKTAAQEPPPTNPRWVQREAWPVYSPPSATTNTSSGTASGIKPVAVAAEEEGGVRCGVSVAEEGRAP